MVHLQILNRTNNIFELVTVEAVPDRLEVHNRDILGSEIEGDDHRNLRLKGVQNVFLCGVFFTRAANIDVESTMFRSFLIFCFLYGSRSNDIHGELANDYVSRHPSDAGIIIINKYR